MLHQQVREARIRAGLTQVKLAELADVPRSQLRKFEEGGNITLSTLRKIVAQLPELRSLSLGAVEIATGGIDPVAVRQAATELVEASRRLLAAVGASVDVPVPDQPPEKPKEPPAGATRVKPEEIEIRPELRERLKRMEEDVRRMTAELYDDAKNH